MGIRQEILARGKKALFSPALMRLVSDDRVMRAADGLMDARGRLRDAWKVLTEGYALPNIEIGRAHV